MTTLRGIDFGTCWHGAGVQGWAGEGYWFHHLPFAKRMFDFTGSTRVAKTTTLYANKGNMPLKELWQNCAPKEYFPKCIWWSLLGNQTINAVKLAGPGANTLCEMLFSLRNTKPYMISFMSVQETLEERLLECKTFVAFFKEQIKWIRNILKVGLQINLSCPNTGHDTKELIEEAKKMLDIAAVLEVPLILKINILPPPETIAEIDTHPALDAWCFTNALPFGSMPEQINWGKIFPNGSPLPKRNKAFGPGGYSGPELLPLVCEYSRNLRNAGVTKPFNLGGGIRSERDVDYAVEHGLLLPGRDSIFFASAAIVRPWNINSIIKRSHELLR